MTALKISERTFLKDLALQKFNRQKGFHFLSDDCDIQSIPPEYEKKLGYEIVTTQLSDFFRIRMYLDFGSVDNLHDFSLKVSPPFIEDHLDDEVFVALGTVANYHRFANGYRFKNLSLDPTVIPLITTTNNEAIVLSNGGFILLA